MRIGLFLDVDGVLTVEPVNIQLARLLNVKEEFAAIEKLFAEGKYDHEKFNEKYIPLFRKAGFTSKFLKDNFDDIRQKLGTEELFRLPVTFFLVSSGPSFFVNELAERVNRSAGSVVVSPGNIHCTQYKFDRKGVISPNDIQPATSPSKAEFVKSHASRFDLSIGVGDSKLHDSAFLSQCNVQVLMGKSELGYLNIWDLDALIFLVRSFTSMDGGPARSVGNAFGHLGEGIAKLLRKSPYEKNVFIMTPFRADQQKYRVMVKTIRKELKERKLKGWAASDMDLDKNLWNSVQCFMLGCKYGIAVFTDEDDVREAGQAVYNPNVSIEAGYMMSRGKNVLLLKDQALKTLPTDFMGELYRAFDLPNADLSLKNVIKYWVDQL